MPFLPLSIVIFGSINKNFKIYNITILIFFVCAMLIGQPILGGPDNTVNNVGRIANLSYPILTFVCFKVWNFENFIKKDLLFYIFILGMFFGHYTLHTLFLKFLDF